MHSGAAVALELAASRPDLVRRLVLVGVPVMDRMPVVKQETMVLRTRLTGVDDAHWSRGAMPNARFVELTDDAAHPFETAPKALATQISAFLGR